MSMEKSPGLWDEENDGADVLAMQQRRELLQKLTGGIMAALEPRFSGLLKGPAMKYAIARVDSRLRAEGVQSADELCYILAGFLRELSVEQELCAIFDRDLQDKGAADRVVEHIRERLRDPLVGLVVRHKADGNLMHELGNTVKGAQLDHKIAPMLVEMVWQAVRRRAGLSDELGAESAWART